MEIKRYLDSNYREDISLDILAEIAHINKYYLAHTFQKEYGISPITYLNRRRIEESKMCIRDRRKNRMVAGATQRNTNRLRLLSVLIGD